MTMSFDVGTEKGQSTLNRMHFEQDVTMRKN